MTILLAEIEKAGNLSPWEVAPQIKTGIALAAFAIAVAAWVIRYWTNQSARLIKSATPEDRGKLIDHQLEFFAVDPNTFKSDKDKLAVVIKQIEARSRRYTIGAIVFTLLAIIIACLALTAIIFSSQGAGGTGSEDSKPSKKGLVAGELPKAADESKECFQKLEFSQASMDAVIDSLDIYAKDQERVSRSLPAEILSLIPLADCSSISPALKSVSLKFFGDDRQCRDSIKNAIQNNAIAENNPGRKLIVFDNPMSNPVRLLIGLCEFQNACLKLELQLHYGELTPANHRDLVKEVMSHYSKWRTDENYYNVKLQSIVGVAPQPNQPAGPGDHPPSVMVRIDKWVPSAWGLLRTSINGEDVQYECGTFRTLEQLGKPLPPVTIDDSIPSNNITFVFNLRTASGEITPEQFKKMLPLNAQLSLVDHVPRSPKSDEILAEAKSAVKQRSKDEHHSGD